MSKFTKQLRQQIVEEFARRHNGLYDPALFLREVKEEGPAHPAYEWFEWDASKAALEHNLWQARTFARDLRINFTIEQVSRSGEIKVVQQEAPLVLSPVEGRKDGGGYVLNNPDDPEHVAEHCRQAGAALRSWLKRYSSALIHVDGTTKAIERLASELEAVTAPEKVAVA